jgi:hypothetical protein
MDHPSQAGVDLVEFIRARLDEKAANADDCPCMAACERMDSEQVLAEVAALRRLLEQLDRVECIADAREVWSIDVDELRRTLASIWADHGQYDPAWAPEEVQT